LNFFLHFVFIKIVGGSLQPPWGVSLPKIFHCNGWVGTKKGWHEHGEECRDRQLCGQRNVSGELFQISWRIAGADLPHDDHGRANDNHRGGRHDDRVMMFVSRVFMSVVIRNSNTAGDGQEA